MKSALVAVVVAGDQRVAVAVCAVRAVRDVVEGDAGQRGDPRAAGVVAPLAGDFRRPVCRSELARAPQGDVLGRT